MGFANVRKMAFDRPSMISFCLGHFFREDWLRLQEMNFNSSRPPPLLPLYLVSGGVSSPNMGPHPRLGRRVFLSAILPPISHPGEDPPLLGFFYSSIALPRSRGCFCVATGLSIIRPIGQPPDLTSRQCQCFSVRPHYGHFFLPPRFRSLILSSPLLDDSMRFGCDEWLCVTDYSDLYPFPPRFCGVRSFCSTVT